MKTIAFPIIGQPAPQGSKRHVGGGRMVESSKKVAPWRQDVVAAARDAIEADENWHPFGGAVKVRLDFTLTRPKSHYRTGKFAHELRPNAPDFISSKPDLDKLVRSTFDALSTAGIWTDDNLAAIVRATKRYAPSAGAYIEITEIVE